MYADEKLAGELQAPATHPSVNGPNILRLADALQELIDTPASVPVPLGFNMSLWLFERGSPMAALTPDKAGGHACRTVGCIAGWAVTLAGQAEVPNADSIELQRRAREWLGLDGARADALFLSRTSANAEQAVRTLRHLAMTGEVSWLA